MDRGSTFHFTVDVGVGTKSTQPHCTTLAGKTALVVDDNLTNRRILLGMLSRWGVKAAASGSAAEALDVVALQRVPFDIVISDGHMPLMDGFEFARHLRGVPGYAATPILMLSSGAPEEARLAREAGAQGHLLKPADSTELLDMLLSICRESSPSETKEPRAVAGVQPACRDVRILLVEDNLVNQKVAQALLKKAGYGVTVAENGLDALDLLSLQPFDICLMDIQMPVMDGLTATAEIRRREGSGNRMPIIAMTANAMIGDRERFLGAGMDDYVSKPLDPANLYRVIERWAAVPVAN